MIDTSTAAVEKMAEMFSKDAREHIGLPSPMAAMLRALAAERDALAARAEAAEKIVERLPKTADGVPIAPGMMVYTKPSDEWDDGERLVTGLSNFRACPPWNERPDRDTAQASFRHAGCDCREECDANVDAALCYSTRELAEAAKGKP